MANNPEISFGLGIVVVLVIILIILWGSRSGHRADHGSIIDARSQIALVLHFQA